MTQGYIKYRWANSVLLNNFTIYDECYMAVDREMPQDMLQNMPQAMLQDMLVKVLGWSRKVTLIYTCTTMAVCIQNQLDFLSSDRLTVPVRIRKTGSRSSVD